MVRNILSVIAGIVISFIVILLVESFGHNLYPPPADLDPRDTEAVRDYISNAPATVFLVVLLAYAAGSLIGGMSAGFIATTNKMRRAMTVGGILMGLGLFNMFSVPHPIWVVISAFFAFLPFAYLGGRIALRRSTENKA